ncbi:MAG TPA: MCE family protein, partial [Nocardioidaceae bacterium]|nr:MCE family protein [Nocardioidaceae bacterium]
MRENKTMHRVAGIGLILVVLSAFVLTAALYTHAFSNPADITLRTSRIGLVMDPGNVVKMRGIKVGTVGEVHPVDAGTAELVLEIDRDQLAHIPANVTAQIRSTTVFGAKYVELVAPADAVAERLDAGAVLTVAGVTTEINTVFRSLDRVLTGIDAADLNTTLTVLARTLDGRGDSIAAIATQADSYLAKLEPLLPQLRRDLREAAAFARVGEAVSPALL